ncbi:CHAD domain-containing protein [Streptomyces sp. P1-3]|uniref:CHAD domain-containing protein n=1 Tax=Streptomyces sp. P1-3 TaxID=3421658 RepID=UPI003D36EF75
MYEPERPAAPAAGAASDAAGADTGRPVGAGAGGPAPGVRATSRGARRGVSLTAADPVAPYGASPSADAGRSAEAGAPAGPRPAARGTAGAGEGAHSPGAEEGARSQTAPAAPQGAALTTAADTDPAAAWVDETSGESAGDAEGAGWSGEAEHGAARPARVAPRGGHGEPAGAAAGTTVGAAAGTTGAADGRDEAAGAAAEGGAARGAPARGGVARRGGRGEPAGAPGRAGAGRGGGRSGEPGGALTVGAARAGALLERQLTLARTRAHTAALQALGSARFHAVADAVALLASDVPLDPDTAARPAEQVLSPLAELAHRRLVEAVDALPLGRAGHPYNAEALVHGLAATPAADAPPASERQDAPWHQVRQLVRMRRYALEVLDEGRYAEWAGPVEAEPSLSVRLLAAARALERHRDASEASAAAAAAARTPRIAPATAYALGVLHADQRHEVEAARFAFGRVWQRIAAAAATATPAPP